MGDKVKNKVNLWSQIIIMCMPLLGLLLIYFFTPNASSEYNLVKIAPDLSHSVSSVAASFFILFFALHFTPIYAFYRVGKIYLGLLFIPMPFTFSLFTGGTLTGDFEPLVNSTIMFTIIFVVLLTHFTFSWNKNTDEHGLKTST